MPRRRKPSLIARIRPFWIIALVLAVLLGWGGTALVQSPWFRLARLSIAVPIGSPVSREQIRAAAAIPAGANVWLIGTSGVERRVEAIPYVDRATVRRGQFPQPYVEIDAAMRRPSACIHGANREVTIDASARVLQTGCVIKGTAWIDAGKGKLPPPGGQVTDRDVTRLLADAKTLADANLAVRVLGRDRWGGLQAVDVTGLTLRFGDDADLAKKVALVAPVREGVGRKRLLRAIDLRAPATPVVEFR
ncbi:MAG TPA: FtsQ-type POTRA domain-containing protein [Candidatus Acidoferrum sp.]|nr:FtsQ-type POTRA domain-containing protein [Candidatus Acidoferrum sp.]